MTRINQAILFIPDFQAIEFLLECVTCFSLQLLVFHLVGDPILSFSEGRKLFDLFSLNPASSLKSATSQNR
jgi:hypothetical protein